MLRQPDFRPFAFAVIALGAILDFAAAVVPYYEAGYFLDMKALLLGLTPYLVYGLFTDVVRGWALLIAGTLLFGIDLGVKIPERFVHYDGYASGVVYWAPLVATLIVVVILAIGARKERRWNGKTPETTETRKEASHG